MIPLRVTLRNFHGIKAGLGRESITLDLTGDFQICAFRGDNGSGKSTIFTWGMTPWREPPNVGSVYDACYGEASRELTFEHDSIMYRTVINIKQTAKSRSMTATIYAGGAVMVLPDGTASDGKAGTYDSCLDYLLGPQELYFLAAYQGQGAVRIAEYTDPKGLLTQLLQLGEIDASGKKVREIAKGLRHLWDGMQQSLKRAKHLEEYLQDARNHLENLESITTAIISEMEVSSARQMVTFAAMQAAVIATGENEGIKKQLASLEGRKTSIYRDRDTLLSRYRADDSTTRSRLNAENSSIVSRRERLMDQERAAKGQITMAKLTMEKMVSVLKAEEALPELKRLMEANLKELDSMRSHQERYYGATVHSAQMQSRTATLMAQLSSANSQCESDRKQAEFTGAVPCEGKPPYDACPALQSAMQAKKNLQDVEHRVAQYEKTLKIANDAVIAAQNATASIGDLRTQITDLTDVSTKQQERISTAERWAAKRQEMDNAEKLISFETARIQDGIEEGALLQDKLSTMAASLEHAKNSMEANIKQASLEADERILGIQREILELPPIASEEALVVATQAHTTACHVKNLAEVAKAEWVANKANAQANIDASKRELAGMAGMIAHATRLELEIAGWSLLATALRGVIDLVIEDAGPSIAHHANQIMTVAYGPRFTVRIVTQKEQRNGVVVETFDLTVMDADTGMEGLVARKSGGQQVWINQAIAYAAAIYFRNASGIDYECLICDETDDGLTEERKAQFYRMVRETMRLGGYKKYFFISHHPAAWDFADKVVNLDEL